MSFMSGWTELSQMTFYIFSGAFLMFHVVFWGSGLLSWIYGSYIHDGEKSLWNLPEYLRERSDCDTDEVYFLKGFLIYLCVGFCVISAIALFLEVFQDIVPYTILAAILTWFCLYLLRGVTRLQKNLKKHTEDKEVHK